LLVERGWILRVPSPHDRRSLDVELTPDGKHVVDEALTRHTATQKDAISALTPRDRADLDRVMRKLLAHLATT
jgi:DNA-binding MarR family transcriptional regulator